MKKIVLTLALFAQLSQIAKAETALTIKTTNLSSNANFEVIVFAHDLTTEALVGQTKPIMVTNSGDVVIDLDDIEWEGTPPSSNWGWGYAEVKVSCSNISTSATPNLCGSFNVDGALVGHIVNPNEDCFEISVDDCGAVSGETVTVKMGNSGNSRPSYPSIVTLE